MIDRLEACASALASAEADVTRLRQLRLELVGEALEQGVRPSVVARSLGLSVQRLSQLRQGASGRVRSQGWVRVPEATVGALDGLVAGRCCDSWPLCPH